MSTALGPAPAPRADEAPADVGSVVMLAVLVGVGTLVLSAVNPLLGGTFAVVGVFFLWKCLGNRPAAARADSGPRLSRLAFISTLVGTCSLGVSFGTGMMLPSAGAVGVALALLALRLIRRWPEKVWGRTFGYVGVVLGLAQLFIFAIFINEARETGFQTVA